MHVWIWVALPAAACLSAGCVVFAVARKSGGFWGLLGVILASWSLIAAAFLIANLIVGPRLSAWKSGSPIVGYRPPSDIQKLEQPPFSPEAPPEMRPPPKK